MSEITITATFLSNIKKEAKKLKNELPILHTEALERVARNYGFSSYHALQKRYEYVKTQGNRGKQLNPNQKSSLIIVIPDDAVLFLPHKEGADFKIDTISFKDEYWDKGFIEEIGARKVSENEVGSRGLKDTNGHEVFGWGYLVVEFLKSDDGIWEYEEACEHLRNNFDSKVGRHLYRDNLWIDDKPYNNHHYKEEVVLGPHEEYEHSFIQELDGF
jgi:hypothetical protein